MQSKSAFLLTKHKKIAVLCLLPIFSTGILFLCILLYSRWIAPHLLPCPLRLLTGRRCPACGVTHSLYALCRGDMRDAVRENLMIPLMLLLGIVYYIELWLRVLYRQTLRLIPRSAAFWLALLGFWLVYAWLRNYL